MTPFAGTVSIARIEPIRSTETMISASCESFPCPSTSSPCEMEPLERLESTRLDTKTMTVCKEAGKCDRIQEEFKERWKRIPLC
jgi:hypothetical protein